MAGPLGPNYLEVLGTGQEGQRRQVGLTRRLGQPAMATRHPSRREGPGSRSESGPGAWPGTRRDDMLKAGWRNDSASERNSRPLLQCIMIVLRAVSTCRSWQLERALGMFLWRGRWCRPAGVAGSGCCGGGTPYPSLG